MYHLVLQSQSQAFPQLLDFFSLCSIEQMPLKRRASLTFCTVYQIPFLCLWQPDLRCEPCTFCEVEGKDPLNLLIHICQHFCQHIICVCSSDTAACKDSWPSLWYIIFVQPMNGNAHKSFVDSWLSAVVQTWSISASSALRLLITSLNSLFNSPWTCLLEGTRLPGCKPFTNLMKEGFSTLLRGCKSPTM